MKKNIKLIVATHKSYEMPQDDNLYIPLHVGKKGKKDLGYLGDDTGDNISEFNPYYCELTGLYWAWKNLDYDYLGLVHYRRYFAKRKAKFNEELDLNQVIWDQDTLEQLLEQYDVIVPQKRKYYIETLYSHYEHTLDKKHLDDTRHIINGICPTYIPNFDKVMKQRSGYMFNMFIMDRKHIDAYLSWLFPILEKLYQTTDLSQLTPFEARLFGRVSELLFNVWLDKQSVKIKEVPFVYLDRINFFEKGKSFLMAKFLGKKYGASF